VHQGFDTEVAVDIECVEIGLQPRPRAFDSNFIDRNGLVANCGDGAPGQEYPDGSGDAPSSKRRRRPAAAQQCLVHIMVEHLAKSVLVFATKIAREHLRQRIADRIRVTDTLAFDDFDHFCRFKR
jgi:hypothetical protein